MKLNKQIAYALAYILKNKYNAIIANISEMDDNFIVDFDPKNKLSINDFSQVEKDINNFIKENNNIIIKKISKDKLIKSSNAKINKYYLHWIKNNCNKSISVVEINKDFCFIYPFTEQIEIDDFKKIQSFKLRNISGVYWLADAKNKQLQRISGYAFSSKQEAELFEHVLQDKLERDHRKLGAELELFTFDDLAGQGHPIWLPNGTAVANVIDQAVSEILIKRGFMFVSTPILGSVDLYKTSGHWFHYKENMYNPLKIDNDQMVLRPMTCPHHMLVYKAKPRSYRDLPFSLAEKAILHRYEASGALIGLERVRCMQLIDTHNIVRSDQIVSEIRRLYDIIMEVLNVFKIKIHRIDLSLHDPKNKQKYFDNPELWVKAEKELEQCMKDMHMEYVKKIGEAAFYGPKIDLQMQTALGHIITMSTIQLDFLLPERFQLEFIDDKGKKQRPILIHGGIIGTLERFMAILLESTKGVFPLWLAPIQVEIIPISNQHLAYCQKIKQQMLDNKIRVHVDNSDERLAKKIRNAQIKKIPYQIIIGDNEIKSNIVSYRQYSKKDDNKITINEFIKLITKLNLSKK